MELVVNDEPVTIKITIEVITAKKKENIKEEMVIAPVPIVARQTITPEGWDAVEPETPTVVPPAEPVVIPEKKKRAYTKKTKDVIPVDEKTIETLDTSPVKPVVPATPAVPANKVVARLAQMIRFYCKASNIPTTEITKKYLIDHGAADIIEGATDADIEEAFKEVVKT